MIAPLRESQAAPSTSLSGARRAVAEIFFRPSSERPAHLRVSRRTTWMVVGWAFLVAIAYLLRGKD